MNRESEIAKLKNLIDHDGMYVGLLKTINSALLAGVAPLTIVNEIQSLKDVKINQPIKKISDFTVD